MCHPSWLLLPLIRTKQGAAGSALPVKYGSLTYGPLPRLVDYTHEGGRAVAPGFRACQESRKPPWALTSRTLWFTEKL